MIYNEIDLHGLNHEQAIIKVEEWLLITSLTKIVDVKIITGKSPQLQKKLIKLFDKYEFSYYIPSDNIGVMYVSDNLIK